MEPGSSSGIKMVNQEFVKLNYFDGTNYPRSKDKMMFLLTFLKIAYVLDVNHPATEPQEEAIQVGAIIAKLPLSWNNYRKKLLHSTEDFSVDQLLKHFQIEEETRIRDKMHQVQPSSKVNYVSEKNKNINPNGVGKKRKYFDSDSNKKHVTCYNCGKKGHIKKDCRFRKKQKTFGMPNVQVAETNVEEIVAMVSNLHIGMVTELNMAAAVKSFDWWYDFGATVHVCNDKNQFKHYEDATEGQQVLMGNANTTAVLGKGNVEVQFTSGKKFVD
ncbi:UNVERIFIED_CONTAM: hypothetical protein Sangu_2770700 [Sesamum angustifolium]|uniref:CCHC-type domain-containing protein n=1 Tax=Sesamum angustifolium TaxID=2727405 RepID=A0AAW2IVG7_9LAMI